MSVKKSHAVAQACANFRLWLSVLSLHCNEVYARPQKSEM